MTQPITSAPSFWDRLLGYFRSQLGPDPKPVVEESPLNQLLQPLDQLRHQALDRQIESRHEAVQKEMSEEQQLLLDLQAALRGEILELHRQLETGLQEPQLQQMSQELKRHCKDYRATRSDQLNELAMLSVMARFHQEALEWAWDDFQRRLEAVGLNWPEPTGLAPHADASEVEQHRTLHRQKLHSTFLQGGFLRLADLILGIVPAWGTVYPERGGPVWRESVFEAVAGALACRRLSHLEKLAEAAHEKLEALVAQALAERLRPVQEKLAAGVGSVIEARNLSDQAINICQSTAPDVVWNYLKPEVEKLTR